ncbi:MAG TPA: ChbG/HpnK family deacetylase [Pirellulales bacterium]
MLTIVLHADDFGLNQAVTDGILRGFTHGLLTSTSLLANAPYAARGIRAWKQFAGSTAERAARGNPLRRELDEAGGPFDFGIHLNLTQGRPLTGRRYPSELLDGEGLFPGVFALFARLARHGANKFAPQIRDELAAQVACAADHGVSLTHLNGHQYIEILPAVAPLLPDLLAKFAIPAVRVSVEPALARNTLGHGFRLSAWLLAVVKRHYARRAETMLRRATATPAAFFGTAHAGRVDIRTIDLFLGAAGQNRVVEIGLHPGLEDERIRPSEICEGWHDPLASHRPRELALLESPLLAERLRSRGVRLGRLSDLQPTILSYAA